METSSLDELGAGERSRALAVRDWYRREPGWTDRFLSGDSSRARALLDGLFDTKRGQQALQRATSKVLDELDSHLLDNVQAPSVEPVAAGDVVQRTRALQRADDEAARAGRNYVAWLSGQGAVAGAASLSLPLAAIALAADVGVAVTGALRAAAHMLVCYGVPASDSTTVRAAIDLAGLATETDPTTRQQAISATVARLTAGAPEEVDAEQFPRLVAQQIGSRAVREIVEQTVRRAVRRRAVRVVPLFGAAASGLASGWLARRVTEAGRHVGATYFLHHHAGIAPGRVLGLEPAAAI